MINIFKNKVYIVKGFTRNQCVVLPEGRVVTARTKRAAKRRAKYEVLRSTGRELIINKPVELIPDRRNSCQKNKTK